MKKLIFGFIATVFLCITGIAQNKLSVSEKLLIDNFKNSKDFTNNLFLSSKSFDFTKATVNYSDDGNKTVKLNIPQFNSNGILIGSLEAIKKATSTYFKLPNDNNYFMNYRDFLKFDFNSLTGYIDFYDCNYDNYKFNSIIYSNGISKSYNFISCPKSILTKYQGLIEFNSNSINSLKTAGKRVPCDSNGNGNVSFSECYSCFNGSCASNPTCYTMCYGAGDVLGWVSPAPGIPMCQVSIGLACVYIAAAY